MKHMSSLTISDSPSWQQKGIDTNEKDVDDEDNERQEYRQNEVGY